MPLSKIIKANNLVPGKKYYISIQWNLTNSVRLPAKYSTIGTYIDTCYVRGRTHSFDSGLKILLAKSRNETTFIINGEKSIISSVNDFYEILTPPCDEIAKIHILLKLPLHNDIKKHIAKYTDYILDLYYRPRPVNKKLKITVK
tara:strand:+ start:727 stop:1158 length:432 start_codon:yes stop_codon:yes gene_type:complete